MNIYEDSMLGDSMLGSYYRLTYNGIGIYEAFRQNCTDEQWKEFLNSDAARWLRKPQVNKYRKSYASFFTQEGYDKFNTITLPVFLQVLDIKKITTMTFKDVPYKYELIYYDDNQVVVDLDRVCKQISELSEQFFNVLQEATMAINSAIKPQERKSREITSKDDLDYLLNIDHEKASEKDTIMSLFGNFGDGPRFNPYDLITVPPKKFGGLSKRNDNTPGVASKKTNSVSFTTTVGLWIFNKSFIEPMSDVLGYINEPVNKGVYGSINKKISYALLEDKITVEQLKEFIMQSQIVMSCCSAIASSHTEIIFSMEELIAKKKEELLKQDKYKKCIENTDLAAMKDLENELITYAKDILQDDPSIDMYDSGARSSWGNNFKNMYLMRSGIKKTDGTFSIVTSSYIEGMDEKDYTDINDAAVGGPFSRSRKTASGGYLERLLLGATAHLHLTETEDCGSTQYIEIDLTKKNASDWYFSNMIIGNRLVELTPDNASKYVDKRVKFRFSSLCKDKEGICKACAGSSFRRIGISNVGMATSILGSSLKNSAMKAFHSTEISLSLIRSSEIFEID